MRFVLIVREMGQSVVFGQADLCFAQFAVALENVMRLNEGLL
jgi:hypothetical protein